MNRRLIEDESSSNPMTTSQLVERMRGWLAADWAIEILLEQAAVAGYVVYRVQQSTSRPEQTQSSIRQFYIERERRGRGLGRAAMQLLMETRFPPGCRITLDVLTSNPGGLSFWQQLGFEPYRMHLQRWNTVDQ